MGAVDYLKWMFGGVQSRAPLTQGGGTKPRHAQKRSFEAAARDRITSSWSTTDQTVNQSALHGLRAMRARSRDWFRNNEYGRKFARLVVTNIVGHAGFALKVDCRNAGKPDVADSRRIADAYARWTKLGQFDVTGQLTETMFDQLLVQMVARDGEALIRFVYGADRGVHHFQVELIRADVLPEDYNVNLSNGHRIRMGVEFDQFMKPVAYHLRTATSRSDMDGNSGRRFERVPATEMLHIFLAEEIHQWRGVPWACASLRDSHLLDQFDEAALVAANTGAAKMGFYKSTDGEDEQPMSGEVSDDSGDFVNTVEPGTFEVIPRGYELQEWNPDYPSAVYDPFVKAIIRRAAVGLNVAAHSLSGDLTEVNFSSIRSGTLEEREGWKVLQGAIIAQAKEPIFAAWLSSAMMFDADLVRLPQAQYDKFNAPQFHGRRWDWVDPKADIAADREAVALGIKSRAQIIRDQGRDPDVVWAELDAETQRGFAQPAQPGAAAPATP